MPILAKSGGIGDPLGVLETFQEMPGLDAAVIRARLAGLSIAGFSMGLLFLALLMVVIRSDRLIDSRNQQLARAYADLQAAEALRDDLTDMIVHDLRSPLTAIGLHVNLLERSGAVPEARANRARVVSSAKESVTQMLSMIDDLLDVARLESGGLQVNPIPFHIGELLQERVALFMPQADGSAKRIDLIGSPNVPMVSADLRLNGRVIDNLVGNALKFTAEGGRVSISVEQEHAAAVVQIADDGEGIPGENLDKIFEKFAQVTDEFGEPIRRGTGIGLAFCKLAVQAHRGSIWVESAVGQGSRFFFTLPLADDQSGIVQ